MFPRARLFTSAAALLVAAALLSAPLSAAWAQKDGVAAVVNGDKILVKDLEAAISTLQLKGAEAEAMKPEVLNQIINEKLIEEAIVKAKVDETEEYKNRLAVLKIQLQRQVYLEDQIRDKISDRQVRAEYDKFVKQNKDKPELRARHILVPSEAEAVQVIKDLDAGADFTELAQRRSSDPSASRGGDLGYFLREEMVPDFSKAAFAIKPGSYSKKPVKTQFGWHVIKVEERRNRAVPSYEQVAEVLRQQLGNEALRKLIEDLRAKAKIETFLSVDGQAAAGKKK